jgi:hemerythrin-like domain-containing protein
VTSDIAMLDACNYCHHKRENHMLFHNVMTQCDFPESNCQIFEADL